MAVAFLSSLKAPNTGIIISRENLMQANLQQYQLQEKQPRSDFHWIQEILWYASIPFLLSIVLLTQYSAKMGLVNMSNYYIPDSYTYELRSLSESALDGFASISFNYLNQFLYHIGSPSFLILNTAILIVSIRLCRNIFQYISPQAVSCARLSIILNPYLLIGAIGPNKETLLMFACLLFWNCAFNLNSRKRLFFMLLIALAPLFVRPVASIPLFLSIFFAPTLRKNKQPVLIVLACLGAFFLINSTPWGGNIISQLQDDEITSFQESRIYEISLLLKQYSKDVLLQYPAFIGKSILILFAPITRPLRLFDSQIALLDLGYSFMAYLLLPFNLAMTLFFLKGFRFKRSLENTAISEISFFAIISVLCVVLNSIITFRYIFPYLPFIFPLFAVQGRRGRSICILLSLFMISMAISLSQVYGNGWNSSTIPYEIIPRFMEWL
jgi:hypothetical protein